MLDDFGLQSLENHKRQDFMEIIEDRHRKRSTIIISQLPVASWHEIIAEQTIVEMVHYSLRIDLLGESSRRKKSESTAVV
ncbi:ATP-binding protein [Flavobacterium sp. JAS]|nr:ATP-binding protein [Flavobacterium sp. JAS]